MNPILAGVALAVVAGAVVAVSARDARIVVLALAVVLVATPVLAEPAADAARPWPPGIVGGVLAAYLLWIAVARPAGGRAAADDRRRARASAGRRTRCSRPRRRSSGFAAPTGSGLPPLGPALASAAGFAHRGVAVIPVLTGRDILRVGRRRSCSCSRPRCSSGSRWAAPRAPVEQLLTAAMLVVPSPGPSPRWRAGSARMDGRVRVRGRGPARVRRQSRTPIASTRPERANHRRRPTTDR